MNKLLVLLALVLLGFTSARAQLGSFGEFPIEITAEDTGVEEGGLGTIAVAKGNVVIRYGTILIYCDYAQYNRDTRDVLVQSNVRLYRDGQLFTGDRALYNLESKRLVTANFSGEFTPFAFAGDSFSTLGGNAYLVKDGLFTTSDNSKPDYHLKAKTIRIYRKDRIIFSDCTLYVGRTPVLWFPYYYQDLNRDVGFSFTPGYKSDWGAFILGTYGFSLGEGWTARLRLDILADRGVAGGLESKWTNGKGGRDWGRFQLYAIQDQDPGTNQTDLAREPIDPGRYRISLQAKQYLTDDIYATVDINKLSDARFLQDFDPAEFRRAANPDNAIGLTYLDEDYSVTLLGRENLNEKFFDGTERLPELALDIKRQPFFGSRLFYQGETSTGFYRRNFAAFSEFQDYETFRADSFHQFVLPLTVHNVSIVPRVGVRGTYYGDTGFYLDRTVTETVEEELFDQATGLTEIAKREITKTERILQKGGSVFRPVVNAGFEMSTKWSKAFENVQSRKWGLDGLRHIIQPWMNFQWTYSGEDPGDLLQFDRLNRSTQLPPIDYPEFNTIDSIDSGTTLRLGLRNRWQTRRDSQTINWLEWNTYFDAYLDRQESTMTLADGGSFSNVFNRIQWNPLPWARFNLDSQLPIIDRGFTEVNTNVNLMVTRDVEFTIGHRYINGNPFFTDSNYLDFGSYVRLGDNWGFSFRDAYEFETGILERQLYQVHRDLSSWVASLGFSVRDNGSSTTDYGVILTFTLKDLPNVQLPFSFDPEGVVGGGSGKNK